jgi:hemerythrin
MIESQYPDMDRHLLLHRGLLSEENNKLHQLNSGVLSPMDVYQFLFKWFALHTSSEDKKRVAYFCNNLPL